jgi:glycosyltransferase involved in cell wall biosynthesis
MKAWLEAYFQKEKVGEYVELPGGVHRTEIVSFFQNADVCVLPSLWENLPYTCLESMSCGTPVIGSRIGGFPEIITEGIDGFLFEPGNHNELAKRIIDVVRNEKIDALCKKARERIESTYCHKVIAEKTIKLYEKVQRETR